jgi:hypothetical protein
MPTTLSVCDNLLSSPPQIQYTPEMLMSRRTAEDVISQAELRKGAEFTIGTSAAIRLVRELYMLQLCQPYRRGL